MRDNPKILIAAIPVASNEAFQIIKWDADETVCAYTPEPFTAVGNWYEDFGQVTDEDVIHCLETFKEG